MLWALAQQKSLGSQYERVGNFVKRCLQYACRANQSALSHIECSQNSELEKRFVLVNMASDRYLFSIALVAV